MIYGAITLEDFFLEFKVNDNLTVTFTVTDTYSNLTEKFTVEQDKFFKALAIAIHNDGTPDWQKDYPDAESIMGKIRWIP